MCPPSSAVAATHPVHVTVDLHYSSIGAPDPVKARGAGVDYITAGVCRDL